MKRLIPKEIRVYSGLADLPRGSASDVTIPGCMVLEGGAFRGLYTSGVLDLLMENDINLQTTVGVSAGALNGINYVSGDIGRSAAFNLTYRHDSRWVGMKALRQSKSITGFSFLFDEGDRVLPFNGKRFYDSDRKYYAVATNLLTGKPVYFDNRDPNIQKAVSASASMPFVSANVVICGRPFLDGGCSVKIPVDWALEQGFEKIVVVTTRDASYRRKPFSSRQAAVLERMYHSYPAFVEAMKGVNDRYNETCDLMDRLEQEGRIFRIAPTKPVTVSRLEGDMEKLGDLYYQGYNDAADKLDALKEYLKD